MRKSKVLIAATMMLFAASACGDDGDSDDAATGDAAAPTIVSVTAKDFTFDLPSTIEGGTIEMRYKNEGKEPHFAAFAKPTDGKTFADVKAALTTPPSGAPSGPPPFTEVAGAPTADPGAAGEMTFDLAAGTYALFCAIPSPDGVAHAAKGMVVEVTVTEGETVEQPDAAGDIEAIDFALTEPPELEEGENTVGLSNKGKQLHEINLVELQSGKTVDDLVAWDANPGGPPPGKFHTGVAIAPGQRATATFDLKSGSTYAFVCLIPDSLGDFKSHLSKGMRTASFTV